LSLASPRALRQYAFTGMHQIEPPAVVIPRQTAATAVIHGGFVVAGVVTTFLGPILPVLMARWTLSDERAGAFFTAQFACSMAGAGFSSAFIPRRGYRPTLILGFLCLALGTAGLGLGSAAFGLSATGVFGFGLGLVLPGSNLWVAEVSESHRAAALSLLNFSWGIGAVASSPLVLLAQKHRIIPALLFGIAGSAGLVAMFLLTMNIEPRKRKAEIAAMPLPMQNAGTTTAVVLAGLFFLYVGVESSVSGWAATHAKRMEISPGNLWALTPMFFWGALLLGRALAPAVLARLSEIVLVSTGLILAASGIGILLQAKSLWGAEVGVAAAGLGLAGVYPVFISWLVKYYGQAARQIGGIMFAMAGLGGATIPWLVGLISTRVGSLRVGLFVPLLACLAMLSLLVLLRQQPLSE
jgi:FHS family glucose/mannose:H+ symporter-like MFS transporter